MAGPNSCEGLPSLSTSASKSKLRQPRSKSTLNTGSKRSKKSSVAHADDAWEKEVGNPARRCTRIRDRATGASNRFSRRKYRNKKKRLGQLIDSKPLLELLAEINKIKSSEANDNNSNKSRFDMAKEAARKDQEKRRNLQDLAPFDPLDPIAMARAAKWQRENPPPPAYKPTVSIEDVETIVPLSYSSHQTKPKRQKYRGYRPRKGQNIGKNQKERTSKSGQAKLKDEGGNSKGTLSNFWYRTEEERENDERLKRDEELTDEFLFGQLMKHAGSLEARLRELDTEYTGKLSVDCLKRLLMEPEYGINHAQMDRMITRITEAKKEKEIPYTDILKKIKCCYKPPRTSVRRALGLPPSKERLMKESVSLPVLLDHGAKRQDEDVSKRRYGLTTYKSTKHLIRPGTGSEGFFPESERFNISRLALQDADRIRKETRTKEKYKNIAELNERVNKFSHESNRAYLHREEANIASIGKQFQRYDETFQKQAMIDIKMANRKRGKRQFGGKKNWHQIEQKIGEEESSQVYKDYNKRSGTDEWLATFEIKRRQMRHVNNARLERKANYIFGMPK